MVKVPSIKVSEADLERAATDLLTYDGWRSLKTDPVSRREWGKGFGEKGMADHLYLRYCDRHRLGRAHWFGIGEILWIEWKRRGGETQIHQRIWIERERDRGALVLLAGEDFPADYDGFLTWYRNSGLMRRKIV